MGITRWIWMLLIVVGLGSAKAEGFSIGGAVGLPTLVDARVVYEEDSFGIRGHATLLGFLGLDVYMRLGDPTRWGYRLGVGLWDFWATSTPFLGWRGLLGVVYTLSPQIAVAFEVRPMFQFDSSKSISEAALSLYLSMVNIGLEFKF